MTTLLSDACAVEGVPLVSAAAVGLEGQLTVYCRERCAGLAAATGNAAGAAAAGAAAAAPCYRCIFPRAPAAKDCTSCARGGVLGPVPGVMGVLQALEGIKVITGLGDSFAGRLLMFDATSSKRPFAVVGLRGRDTGCAACGDQPQITRDAFESYDYRNFTSGGTGAAACALPSGPSKPAAGAAAAAVTFGDVGGYELDDAAAAAAKNASLVRGDGAPPWGTEGIIKPSPPAAAARAATSAGVPDPALHG